MCVVPVSRVPRCQPHDLHEPHAAHQVSCDPHACEKIPQSCISAIPTPPTTREEEKEEHLNSTNPDPFAGAPYISTYTRQQAIAEGMLILVPPDRQAEFGIRFPIALTTTSPR